MNSKGKKGSARGRPDNQNNRPYPNTRSQSAINQIKAEVLKELRGSFPPIKNRGENRVPGKRGVVREFDASETRVMRTGAPEVSGSAYSGDGRTRVRHREYIGDVQGSVDFAVQQFSLNPGLLSTFPWLPFIANNYESYLFSDLKVEYETDRSANTNGSLMLAIDFDAADAAPIDKIAMMNNHNAVRCTVRKNCEYTSSKRDLHKFGTKRYCRSGSLAANLDIKTYDVGNLFVAVQGCDDTNVQGELFITYTVELETPQTNLQSFLASQSAKIVSAGGSAASFFGTTPTVTGGLPVTATGNTITFNKAGDYMVSFSGTGTALTETAPDSSASTVAARAIFGEGVTTILRSAADTLCTITYIVHVTKIGQSLIVDFSGVCTTMPGTNLAGVSTYLYSLGPN